VDQTIKNYLRAILNGNPSDWDEYLALVEFAYSSRYQDSIKIPSFQVDVDFIPPTPASMMLL